MRRSLRQILCNKYKVRRLKLNRGDPTSMRFNLKILIALITVTLISTGAYFLFHSLSIDIVRGDLDPDIKTDEITRIQKPLRQQLIEAGLNITPTLGDIGVDGHMEVHDVDHQVLAEYADNLTLLRQKSIEVGQELPMPFFDVQTEQMTEYGWTPYKVVKNLVQPDNAPYIKLLATSFQRFLSFKEKKGDDSAVDAALDMFQFAKDYLAEIPDSHRAQHLHGTSNHSQAVILTWQTLVAGSTRKNPTHTATCLLSRFCIPF